MSGLWQTFRNKVPGEEALSAPSLQGGEAIRMLQVQKEAFCGEGGPHDAYEELRQQLRVQLRHPSVFPGTSEITHFPNVAGTSHSTWNYLTLLQLADPP